MRKWLIQKLLKASEKRAIIRLINLHITMEAVATYVNDEKDVEVDITNYMIFLNGKVNKQ